MRHTLVLSLSGCLMLAACMGGTAPAPETTASNEPTAPIPAPVTTAPVIEETAPPPPTPDPARLTGLTPAEVQEIMGEPSFVRRDENMQTMLFEKNGCVFEIIFFEPTNDHHFQARHMNARSKSGVKIDEQTCLIAQLPEGYWLDGGANQTGHQQ